jgi:hypothetical protein
MANKYTLKGHHIEVEYTIGGNPGFTALRYKGTSISRDFKPGEVATDPTAFGSLVSVPLEVSIDTGGKTFGFFLPNINVPEGQTADFTTTAICKEFSGPDSFPHRPATWHSFTMQGTAQSVILPL